MVAVSVVRLVTVSRQNERFIPGGSFWQNDVSIGYHIFILAADPSDYRVSWPSGFCWPLDHGHWHFKKGIILSEYCTVYIQATSLLQKLWDRVSQVSEHVKTTYFRPFFFLLTVVRCFIVRLLSRFMAWEIHRTKPSEVVEWEVADSYSFASIFIVFFLRVRVTFSYVTVNPIHSSCLFW